MSTMDDAAVLTEHWQRTVTALSNRLPIVMDHPKPSGGEHPAEPHRFSIAAGTHEALLSRSGGTAVGMRTIVSAVLAALLTRLGAGSDVPLVWPMPPREQDRDNEAVRGRGKQVLLVDTSGNPTFRTLLKRVETAQERCHLLAGTHVGATAGSTVPTRVSDEDLLRQPCVSVTSTDPSHPQGEVGAHDLSIDIRERFGPVEEPAGLEGSLTYNTDLYDYATMASLAQRLIRVLTAFALDPSLALSEVDILSAQERTTLLEAWNATDTGVRGHTLTELVEAQSQRVPDSVAVVSEGTSWTYAQLNARANAIAHRLVGAGIRPEEPVALLIHRSPSLIAAALGVLKAGGCYLPLHHAHPQERMAASMRDAGAKTLLTDEEHAGHEVAQRFSAMVVPKDSDPEGAPAGNLDRKPAPGQSAYIMYTSGTSGTPKGIVVTHEAVASFVLDDCFSGTPIERMLVHTPLAFDPSNIEVWAPLVHGGQLVIAPPIDLDAGALKRIASTYGLTHAQFVGGHFKMIAEDSADAFQGLSAVFTGGEVISPVAVRKALQACPGLTVHAMYGPTETTTAVTRHRIESAEDVTGEIPIGTPMANRRAYVLDEDANPLPPGTVGELFVGGAGIARGYMNQPELTEARFIPDPFRGNGARMYRTGDLARWTADGVLMFSGRTDSQVKVRGYRIELGEIETVLAEQDGVRQVAVVVRQDDPDGHRLVAYVVPAPGQEVDPRELAQETRRILPEYMVPSAIVSLTRLPLTPNGKLDLAALPYPDYGSEIYRAPRTGYEKRLCTMFAEVLCLDRVGIDDDFFVLGGDSILATRLRGRIRSELGVDVKAHGLAQNSTVAELAASTLPETRPMTSA